jgi:hypothetical protein
MAKATSRDLYMQFDGAMVTSDGADATTLVSTTIETGLSIRGMLVFLVHQIEVIWQAPQWVSPLAGEPRFALSTVEGLAAMPALNDKGTIAKFHWENYLNTSGAAGGIESHKVRHFLPPVPIAAPSITAYLKFENDAAGWQSSPFEFRICFTTAPIDAGMYTEIAETWGW